MNFYKNVAYVFLWSILGVLIFMLLTWGIFWINSNNLVQDRLSELVILVSEENCLSNDGSVQGDTHLEMYDNLLKASETSWLKFKTNTIDGFALGSNDLSYHVTSEDGSKSYYSYIDAPQKGSTIRVELTGYLSLPLLYNPTGTEPKTIDVKISKNYLTMGLKYFRDK